MIGVAYEWELRKLIAQRRLPALLALLVIAPFVLVAVLDAQDQVPADTLFGVWVHTSGFAVPLVILGFAGQWAFPVMTSVVAGDIFAGEDSMGTWELLLAGRQNRPRLFAAKVLASLTSAILLTTVLAAASIAAGLLLVGHQPLVGLSGTTLTAGRLSWLVAVAWLSTVLPTTAFTALAILVSIRTRNGIAGVVVPLAVGLLMELYSLIGGPDIIRLALPTTAFFSWHGLMVEHPFYGPLIEGAVVSIVYAGVFLAVAWRWFKTREVL